jgi:hypothetical protein
VYKRADAACPPGSWPAATTRQPAWRAAARQMHMHFDIYHEVVARWNARVAAAPGRHFALRDYFSYLLNIYDALARLNADLGEAELAAVEASWPPVPRFGHDFATQGDRRWLAYVEQARALIDRFYPEIPPLPLMVLIPSHVSVTLPTGSDVL